jgi:hypothetical protein
MTVEEAYDEGVWDKELCRLDDKALIAAPALLLHMVGKSAVYVTEASALKTLGVAVGKLTFKK